MRVDLHPAAEAEARAAWLRFRDYDAAVADRFMVALDHAIEHIEQRPERWPECVETDRVLVVAVAHQRRRPGYWSRRGPR